MKYRVLAAALVVAALAAPLPAAADADPGVVRPVLKHVGKVLFSKLVEDNIWDAVTGKPDLAKMDQRLSQLERCAALRPEMQDEIHKLRQQINDRVTRDEFRRMADRTAEQLRTIEQRLDEHDEEIEKLKVLQEDARNKTANADSAAYFRSRGEGYERDGQKYKAAACYNIAVWLAPKDPAGYLRRSEFYVKLGAGGVAVPDATEAIRLDPNSAVAHYYLGLGHLANGSYKEADDTLTRALDLGPPDAAGVYAARGAARLQRGEHAAAVSDCDESIRKAPNPLAYRTRAMAHVARREFGKAVDDAGKAVRLEPKGAENYLVRAQAWIGRGDFYFYYAVDDAGEAIRLAPKSARGYYLRGLGYACQKKCDAAVKEYTEAIKIDPLFVAAYNARADAYINGPHDADKTNRAIEDATEALRLDPKSVDAYVQPRGGVRNAGR